jgi:hypothetical protein
LHSTGVGILGNETAVHKGVEIVSALAKDAERTSCTIVSNSLGQVFIVVVCGHYVSTCLGLETSFLWEDQHQERV